MTNHFDICPIVVLIGGNGSNLQAIMDHPEHKRSYQVVGVISHRNGAYGLVRAKAQGLAYQVIDHSAYPEPHAFEAALISAIKNYAPQLIVLAGFMRILSPDFVQHFPNQILNIHPSLLPKYKGLNTHQRVLAAKEKEHGVSVHFVTPELDSGPLIAQVTVPVFSEDNIATLTERVHQAEHWLYPQVIAWFAHQRLKASSEIIFDNKPLGPQGVQLSLPSVKGILS
ncbi:MAG: phosphoribosylglycinamide formyltransferase [Candidatus Berkiellales bacterium]